MLAISLVRESHKHVLCLWSHIPLLMQSHIFGILFKSYIHSKVQVKLITMY